MPRPSRVLTKIKELTKLSEESSYLINRNPRNLEKLRIAYKPNGYHLEKLGRNFWHKLVLTASGRYITAQLVHYQNGSILEASTSEWAIKKQLFATKNTSAYVNLARVFAQRCLESGFTEFSYNIDPIKDGKVNQFIQVLKDEGLSLAEPEQFKPHRPWDMGREEKPWEITE